MRKTYKSSLKMKNNILRVAGGFFHKHGYDKTTYQMISDELGISKAAIAYHFNLKPWIIFNIFMRYIREVYSFVKKEIAERDDFNYYKYHCAAQLIIYRAVMKDENSRALFFHKDHIAIWANDRIGLVEDYYREITKDFKKSCNAEELHTAAVMNNGATISMFREFMKNPDESKIDRYCRNLLYLMGVLSKLDEATIERNINFAFDFAANHNLPLKGWLE